MYKYDINDLVLMMTGLLTASVMLKFAKKLAEPVPDPEWLNRLSVTLNGLHKLGNSIDLDSSLLEQISHLSTQTDKECLVPAMVIKDRFDSIIAGVQNNLNSRKFMYVPGDQAIYWDNINYIWG